MGEYHRTARAVRHAFTHPLAFLDAEGHPPARLADYARGVGIMAGMALDSESDAAPRLHSRTPWAEAWREIASES